MSGDWWDDLAEELTFWFKIAVGAIILVPILVLIIILMVIF